MERLFVAMSDGVLRCLMSGFTMDRAHVLGRKQEKGNGRMGFLRSDSFAQDIWSVADLTHYIRDLFAVDFRLQDVEDSVQGSAALRGLVSDLLVPYLALQKGLAAGDYAAAAKQGRLLLDTSQVIVTLLLESGNKVEQHRAQSFDDQGRELVAAVDLVEIRKAFYPLSKTLAELIDAYGTNGQAPLYLQFCPMAFSNTGATWISGTEEINNPDFGPMMLRCGEVQKQIK